MQFAEEHAIVSHLEGDLVVLDNQNSASCSNCSSKSGCGNAFSFFTFKPKNKLKVINSLNLKSGDEVVVGMPSDRLLKATVIMYLSPLLLLFTFSLVAKLFFGETASIIAGLIGLILGLLLVNKYTLQKNIAEKFQPKLIRKIIKVHHS